MFFAFRFFASILHCSKSLLSAVALKKWRKCFITMKFKLLTSLLFLLFASCGAGTNDRRDELAGGYYYIGKSGDMRLIRNHSYLKKHLVIYSIVKDFAFNEDYIIVEQHPNYKSHVQELTDDIWDHNSDIGIFEKRADSILKHDKRFGKIFKHSVNYWIIKVDGDSFLGPLTLEEYKYLRRQLRVPESLKLEVEK
jgi:hypothetical protein